jgi:hypothetical protein
LRCAGWWLVTRPIPLDWIFQQLLAAGARPEQGLSRKFLAALEAAFSQGRLRFSGRSEALADAANFQRVLSAAASREWVVYAKPPFGGPEQVLKYLARYTLRVAISNRRLLDFQEGRVRFRYKDYAHGNRKRVMTLSAQEFVRRLLLHVLPAGFVRIRHYGILANCHRHEKLALCRQLLGCGRSAEPEFCEETGDCRESSLSITPTRVCPVCGAGRMILIEQLPRMPCRCEAHQRAGWYVRLDSS